MIRIVVEAADNAGYSERSGTSKEGKSFRVAIQTVYMHNGKVHPTPVDLRISDGQRPYEPGEYTISASSYKIGLNGRIELDTYKLELTPLRARQTPEKVA